MRSVTILLALTAAVLLAQSTGGAKRRSRSRLDAGTDDGRPVLLGPDPPGRLRADPPARDGGIADAGVAAADGGTRSAQQLQLDELRARIAVLEQQAAMLQQQNQQMATMNEQLQALRQQLAEDSRRRDQERQQERQQHEAVQSAIASLSEAQAHLAAGDTSIGNALDQAQRAFSGQAQRDIEAARYALRNNDVTAARYYLN